MSIEKLKILKELSSKYYNVEVTSINYSELCEDALKLSNASYSVINLLSSDRKFTQTVAVAGIGNNLKRVAQIFGFEIIGKKWEVDDFAISAMNTQNLINQGDVGTSTPHIKTKVASLLKSVFDIGIVYSIGLFNSNKIVGTLVLVMSKDTIIQEPEFIELFAQQMSSLIYKNESELRFKQLVENTNDVFYKQNILTGQFEYLSPRFFTVFGYSTDEVVKMSIDEQLQMFHPEDQVMAKNFITDLINTSNQESQYLIRDFKFKKKDGSFVWVSGKYSLLTEDNIPTHVIGSLREINETKLLELEVKNAKERIGNIINNLDDVLWSMSLPQREVIYVSPSVKQLLGVSQEEFISNISILGENIFEDDKHIIPKVTKQLYEGNGYYEVDYRIIDKNGHLKWVKHKAKIIRNNDNEIIRIDGHISDITNSKVASEILLKSEASLKEAETIAKVGRWELDLAHNKLTWSDSLFDMWETVNSEGNATYENFIESIHPEDREKVNNAYTESIANKTSYNIEHRLLFPFGRIKWIREECRTEYDKEGNALRSIGIAQDITERKYSELLLTELKEKAEAASIAKTDFISSISHEIRTPMNAILGFSELLNNKIIDPKNEKYIKGIRSAGNSLLALINNVLDLSKIEAGAVELNKTTTNIEHLLSETMSVFRQSAKEKGVGFSLEMDPGIPEYLLIDETQIKQILFNLISNSIKFTQTGIVCVETSFNYNPKANEQIDLILSVIDTGVGIPEEKLEIVFEPFRQSDKNVSKKFGGTGLGLTITKKIVELMGGKIEIASKVNVGTTIKVLIPGIKYLFNNEVIIHEEEFSNNCRFLGQDILLVEDIESNRDVVKGFLESYNLNTIEAHNGEEALSVLEKLKPDLILMDLMMPIMNGYETTKIVKSNPKLKDIPIIALTASTLNQNEIRELFDGYLRKPISGKELCLTLKEYLKSEGSLHNKFIKTDKFEDETPVNIQNISSSKLTEKSILIIEDNELNQMYMQSILGEFGLTPIIASSGREALSICKNQTMDLILLDFTLPDINGAELCDELRNSGYNNPIIVVSGFTKEEITIKYPDFIADLYLLKPITADQLNKALSFYLNIEKKQSKIDQNKKYDFTKVKDLTKFSQANLEKYYFDFMSLLNQGKNESEQILKNGSKDFNPATLHGLLNYTVFFGAGDLKNIIRALKQQGNSEETLLLFNSEIKSLISYYHANQQHFTAPKT